jgi:hypothetical protein
MATAVGLNMKITADTAGVGRGVARTSNYLKGLDKSASQAASSLRAISAVQIGGAILKGLTAISNTITNAIRSLASYLSRLAEATDATAKLAQRTGISVESLQAFQLAADLSGVGNFTEAISKLSVKLAQAGQGNKDVLETLGRLGLSFERLNALSPEERFKAVAVAIQGLPSELERSAAAVKLFEEGGIQLLPLFAQNLEEVEARAKRLGIILSGTQTAAIEEMNDALHLVRKTFDGIIGQVQANLAPVVTALAEEFLSFVEGFNAFGGQGGSGIANAITEGLLNFAEFLAAIFDRFVSEFGSFVVDMQAVGEVFRVVANALYGQFEFLRGIFNGFQVINNKTFEIIGTIIEKLGQITFSDTLRQGGQKIREDSTAALAANTEQMKEAFSNAINAGVAAVRGGAAYNDDELGMFGSAVAGAWARIESGMGGGGGGRGGPAAIQQQAATQAAVAAAEAEKKAYEDRHKQIDDLFKQIYKIDEETAKLRLERGKEEADIEQARLEQLSRRSNEALTVGDVRAGGVSEILRIASGREDPAIEEYRKQLAELRKIEQRLKELEAQKVRIIGQARYQTRQLAG